jgi:signal transduction histidine kinase
MDFTAVAHDLRAPLSAMLGHTRLLTFERLSDAGRHRLDIIEAQIHRMVALLDGSMPHTSHPRHADLVDINATIRDVLAELEVMLKRSGVQIAMREESSLPPVVGDGDALHRVLENLIVNAVDSMPYGGRISVRARMTEIAVAPVGSVAVEVVDTGSGIPSDLVERVFDRGFTTKGPGGGSGLGLAICREIVQAHGGRIELSSEPGRGTTVRISVPVAGALHTVSAR